MLGFLGANMSLAILLAAFSMGFFGSPHCLGMCGGIVTAFGLSMQNVSKGKKNALIVTYHLGRLISYSLLGFIASLLGMAIFEPFMRSNIPRIVLGIVLVFIGLSMLGLPFFNQLEKMGMKFWQALAPIRKKVFPIDRFSKALFAGLLWGFLPCGLVYGTLMMAIAGHNIAMGALMMFVFGLGTMPMLIATQKTVGLLRQNIQRFKLRQFNGIVMIVSGLAVMSMPMVMQQLHGSHNAHHMNHDMSHMSHAQMPQPVTDPMIKADESLSHDMSMMHYSASAPSAASNAMPTDMPMDMHHSMNHDMAHMKHSQMHSDMPMPASNTH